MEEIKNICIIEGFTVNKYKLIKVSKTGFTYFYRKQDGDAKILVSSSNVFISEIRALTELEGQLEEALRRVRDKIKKKRGKFFGTEDMDSFKKSVEDMSIEELEQEITGTTLQEVLKEEDKSIYRKQT